MSTSTKSLSSSYMSVRYSVTERTARMVTAVQLTKEGKVKRMYAMKIDDFSAKSLQHIFSDHISREAKITTDKMESLYTYFQNPIILHKLKVIPVIKILAIFF